MNVAEPHPRKWLDGGPVRRVGAKIGREAPADVPPAFDGGWG